MELELTDPAFSDASLIKEIDDAISSIYDLCGASKESHFVFTSCEAESVAQIFYSTLSDEILKSGKNHVLVGNLEGAAPLLLSSRLEEFGCITEMVPVNSEGIITKDILNLFVSPKTSLFSISLAAPLIGTLQPIEEIANYCKERGILLHVSAGGALGRAFFRFSDLPIDFLTFEGSSIGGPLTSGVILSKKKLSPLIPNSSRLNPLRGGTFDPSLLISLGKAASFLISEADHQNFHLVTLSSRFEKGREVLLAAREKLPQVSILSFKGVAAELLLFHLNERGIRASMGGAEVQKLEHILVKCGIDLIVARSSLAFSLDPKMTLSDVDKMAEVISEVASRLSNISKDLSFEDDL